MSRCPEIYSNIGLFAQALHALHIRLHGSGVGDLCGTASRKPASLSISHSLSIAPVWKEHTVLVTFLALACLYFMFEKAAQ